ALLEMLDGSQARDAADFDAARERGERAAAQFAALGWPVLAASAYEVAGNETQAQRIYQRLGAHGELRRSSSLLTPRERELTDVISTGQSNRAAAGALSITEKAVEKHLTSIYAKLGLRSRAQLVAFLAETRSAREK
ncbi:MAG TPA: LuxR C-terminal-related transcriptional regulator, partial [Candidatus Cybelea sp.]